MTNEQLADIFVKRHRNDLRFGGDGWHVSADAGWQRDDTLLVVDLIRKTCHEYGVNGGSMAYAIGAVHRIVKLRLRGYPLSPVRASAPCP
jgi:hypothetical protein